MYNQTRDEEVVLLKKMWLGEAVICPKCGKEQLVHLHKKAKKSNSDWICTACGKRYDAIKILKQLNED